MSYFNMIQLIESSGIGLVYGLRFYSKGQLDDRDIVSYVKTNALLYEYYKQAYEQMPIDIGDELIRLFNSEAFIIVNTRYLIDAATSSGILKAKQKLGRTFNSDKLGGIAFTKISCSVLKIL